MISKKVVQAGISGDAARKGLNGVRETNAGTSLVICRKVNYLICLAPSIDGPSCSTDIIGMIRDSEIADSTRVWNSLYCGFGRL
jgi:hypothetical protein